MSTATAVSNISLQTLAYAPAALAGIQAAETTSADGATKAQAVVNGIMTSSAVEAGSSSPTVAGISALVNFFVLILNATGVFSHKATNVTGVQTATVPVGAIGGV